MAYFARQGSYTQDKPIFAFGQGIRTPRSATLTREFVSMGTDRRQSLPAGIFVARIGSTFRPLPRGKVTVAATTASPRLKVGMPEVFIPGDQLRIVEPYSTLTVASVAEGTFTYNEQSFKFTPTGAATAIEAAELFANHFNSIEMLSRSFRFLATPGSAVITVFSDNGVDLLEFTASGALTAGATMTVNNTVIGTVAFVDPATGELVLSANSAVAVPVGFNIGVKVDDIYGLYNHSLDFTDEKPAYDLGIAHEGNVYLGALPYYDGNIRYHLPMIKAQYKW